MPNRLGSRKGAQIHPTENQIQIAIVEHCWIVHKVTAFHTPNELLRFLNEGQKVFQAKCGTRKGWPDIMIFEPRGKYHGLAIELKAHSKSKVSEEQKHWIDFLNERDYFAKITFGLDDALDTIENYLDEKI